MKGRTDRSRDILRRDDLSSTILSRLKPYRTFMEKHKENYIYL